MLCYQLDASTRQHSILFAKVFVLVNDLAWKLTTFTNLSNKMLSKTILVAVTVLGTLCDAAPAPNGFFPRAPIPVPVQSEVQK